MKVQSEGRAARTVFRLLRKWPQADPPVALLEAELGTGRTHQIRVHLAALHHPLAGDAEYGARESGVHRPMLHAWRLRLRHPRTGKEMSFEAAPPPDFETFWSSVE